jgi:(4S)-4-hydroxy-5-phosphonooxypentane-2,3-dione isomerase
LIAQIVYLSVAPKNRDALVFEAMENARQSLKENGVQRFDVLHQADNPNKLALFEVYDSPKSLDAHRQTSHFKRWQEKALPLLSKPREKILYQIIEKH